jgi:ankyrin repeat protein
MTYLPARPDLEQLRHQAKDLLREATRGDAEALARIHAVSHRVILASAQLAIAREYGFESWPKLKREVERREVLNSRDLERLSSLLAEDSDLAVSRMVNWADHRLGASPLNYIAMIGFDHERLGLPADLAGTGRVAAALIEAGAPVNGEPDDFETPLMTAASYGDVEVAQVLIDAGADIEARASTDAGGVPGGTALMHAAVFGMTGVLDLLVKAGARPHGIESAAAIGDITDWLTAETPLQARIRALAFAADHQRLAVIDQLIDAHTPVDASDELFGRQALRLAAQNGRAQSVRRLLEHGADPDLRDEHGRTALELCQPAHRYLDNPGHDEVDAILRPLTAEG